MKAIFLLRLFYELCKIKKLSSFHKLRKHFSTLYFSQRKMILYRGVGIINEDNSDINEIGICWTYNYDKAYPYNGKGTPHKFYYIYHALISITSINWKETIELNLDGFTYEKEIRIMFNEPLRVIKCEKVTILPCYSDGKQWHFPTQIDLIKCNSLKHLS